MTTKDICDDCPLHDVVRRHSLMLEGSPDLEHPGMVVRLDRVERIAKALVWISSTTLAAIIVGAVGLAFASLR